VYSKRIPTYLARFQQLLICSSAIESTCN